MRVLQHCGFVGDVTALQLVPLGETGSNIQQSHVAAGVCIANSARNVHCQVMQLSTAIACAGMGSQLLVYQLSSGDLVVNHTVFSSGIHIHGVHAVQLPNACLLAVHGERMVKVCFHPHLQD